MSKCVNECRLGPDNVCQGCQRSIEEIIEAGRAKQKEYSWQDLHPLCPVFKTGPLLVGLQEHGKNE